MSKKDDLKFYTNRRLVDEASAIAAEMVDKESSYYVNELCKRLMRSEEYIKQTDRENQRLNEINQQNYNVEQFISAFKQLMDEVK